MQLMQEESNLVISNLKKENHMTSKLNIGNKGFSLFNATTVRERYNCACELSFCISFFLF